MFFLTSVFVCTCQPRYLQLVIGLDFNNITTPACKMVKHSRQSKAGVTLSVSRVAKLLRREHPEKRLSDKAPIYLSGAMENLAHSVLTLAADAAHSHKSKRVNATDLIEAVRSDPDLSRAFAGFAFSSLGTANKAIDYILPQKGESGQKKRREKIRAKKEAREAEKEARRAGAEGGNLVSG